MRWRFLLVGFLQNYRRHLLNHFLFRAAGNLTLSRGVVGIRKLQKKKCFNLSKEHNNAKLHQLCVDWMEWIEGHCERATGFAVWLDGRTPGWEIENEEILKQEVDRIVQQAVAKIVEPGIDDPVKEIKNVLAVLKKIELWTQGLQILIEEREAQKRKKI